MKSFKDKYLDVSKHLKIIDIGSYDVNGQYGSIFRESNWEYYGADIVGGNNVDILLKNAYDWQNIESSSFDVVVSGQAYEHIEYFWLTTLQISRILKVGGIACILAPAGGFEHKYPVDCWRFYPDGMVAIAKWAKMDVLEAFVQWDNQNYVDDSDIWMDAMLICKKTREEPEIEQLLNTSNSWISRKNHFQDLRQTNEVPIPDKNELRQKLFKTKEKSNLPNVEKNMKWYYSIAYLLLVYQERPDLQLIYSPTQGDDLLKLIQWARDFGIKEDPRISPYANFYKEFCEQDNL